MTEMVKGEGECHNDTGVRARCGSSVDLGDRAPSQASPSPNKGKIRCMMETARGATA